MNYFEAKYKCSGICKTTLFYATLNLSEGIPSDSCEEPLKTEVRNSFMYIGVFTFITGVLMFLIWIMNYCLWKNYA